MRVMERIDPQEKTRGTEDGPIPRRVVFVTGGMGIAVCVER